MRFAKLALDAALVYYVGKVAFRWMRDQSQAIPSGSLVHARDGLIRVPAVLYQGEVVLTWDEILWTKEMLDE